MELNSPACYHLTASNYSGSAIMQLHGFGYTFPFPLICEDDHNHWPSVRRTIQGTSVEIYPPFRSGSNFRLTADFDVNCSPSFLRRKLRVDDDVGVVKGLRTLPKCFSLERSLMTPQVETNAMQLEIHTRSERSAEKIASWFVSSGLRNLRRATYQFWIGHPAIYFEGTKRTHYIVENGQLNDKLWARSKVYSGSTRTMVITNDIWRRSWFGARQHFDSDQLDSIITAHHQKASGFLFDAVLNLAVAIEKSKYQLWEKLYGLGLATRSELKAALNDTKKPERYFSDLLPSGSPFQRPNSKCLDAIRRIWIARGIVSHGKET